ncbi:MAG TPA: hypothetical protein VFZ36_10160, partial [Vicinamibacterales bacterium]
MALHPELERWQRIEELFHRAAELPPEARSAFLDAACADDPGLRHEVESLLAAEPADSLIDVPALQRVAGELAADSRSLAGG